MTASHPCPAMNVSSPSLPYTQPPYSGAGFRWAREMPPERPGQRESGCKALNPGRGRRHAPNLSYLADGTGIGRPRDSPGWAGWLPRLMAQSLAGRLCR
jgi:hypothetical protein